MIIPCIDLMGGKVVQLVQGREKALEGGTPTEMLERFTAFPQIQVIDLDAAMGRGSNEGLVGQLASRAVARVGGGVRSVERAKALAGQGANRVIVGTAAFHAGGLNEDLLGAMADAIGTVVTSTIDRLAYSPSPPIVFAVVDFDGGGRYPVELTDADPEEIGAGSRVEMTFRRLFSADGIHDYFWKARPVRTGGGDA